ncbi:MAG: 4Fe-4S binding protein [Pleomorphochaeta sp.]
MLTNKEVFEKFETMHSYSFATINNDYPEIRIAHLLTYDEDGLYFQTMKVKPFYKQLIQTKKVAVLSLVADSVKAEKDENGLSDFPPGFFIRIKGDVRELSFDELLEKEKTNSNFKGLVNDIKRYPTMTTFVINKYSGEVYDYDFEKTSRENKLDRKRFSFNSMVVEKAGFTIDKEKCIACGSCEKVCTFKAIEIKGDYFSINGNYCDECGSCYVVCPVNAITPKCEMLKEDKKQSKDILKKLYF